MTAIDRIKPRFHTDLQVIVTPFVRFARQAVQALPAFFLCYADFLGVPSGLYASFLAAMCAAGASLPGPMAGCLAAVAMRFVWGLAPRWDMLFTLALMLPGTAVLRGRKNAVLIGWTAMTLTPAVVAAMIGGTLEDVLMSMSMLVMGALAAPVMLRAVEVLRSGREIGGTEERIALGFLAVCVVCGGGRMQVAGLHVGVMMAGAAALLMAQHLGPSAGLAGGMVGGMALALAGLPLQVSVCLSVGGFLAGMLRPVGKRWLMCCAFAAGGGLMLLASGTWMWGVLPGVLTASAGVALLPKAPTGYLRDLFRRFTEVRRHGGDAFAASALDEWKRSMIGMASAVPVPQPEDGPRSPAWWHAHLCGSCPEYSTCQSMRSDYAAARAEEAWRMRACTEEEWPAALEKLRGLGCSRLYCLREGMDRLRTEEPERRQAYRRACYQRDMLVTHLTAMAGAAHQLAQLSGGETWWDELGARNIRRLLDEQALPARLMYLRRMDGHACAAIEAENAAVLRRVQPDLTRMVCAALALPMAAERVDGCRLYLAQVPPYDAAWGICSRSMNEDTACGDHAWLGRMSGGRFMAALSDGMGQGERAGQESASTVELLRLCTEAGYDRAQTITAVNGMMLLETAGERFATVDLLTIDLWTGQAALDKLGAAASWLKRGETLVELTGDALPLGILETVESRTSFLRLQSGDCLLLMSDGVEDAFADKEALRRAVAVALGVASPQHAAEAMIESAARAGESGRRDDMTAVVVRMQPAPSGN